VGSSIVALRHRWNTQSGRQGTRVEITRSLLAFSASLRYDHDHGLGKAEERRIRRVNLLKHCAGQADGESGRLSVRLDSIEGCHEPEGI
jgi:hypothetical protein